MSADDWIFPDCLGQLVALAEEYPSVGIVNSYSLYERKVMAVGLEYERRVVPGSEIIREALLGGPYLIGSPTSVLYRSEASKKKEGVLP